MKTIINISNCFSWPSVNQVMNHGRELATLSILDPKQYTGSPGVS